MNAVVTGASSGIGRAIAIGLGKRGAHLVLLARNEGRLRQVAGDLRGSARRVEILPGDLSQPDQARIWASQVGEVFGCIDVFVHCAGTIHLGTLAEAPEEVAKREFLVNVLAPLELTRGLLPKIKQTEGQIVFMNSSVCHQPGKAGLGLYSATRHALKAISDSLRAELNPAGVRVLTVFPGRTASAMQEAVHGFEKREYKPQNLLQPEDIADTVLNALSLPRSAEVTDIFIRPMKPGSSDATGTLP